ncbi:MAG: hydrolase [Chromatiaceae bacterium]|nr:hydrolase [Gammaproteobacteria bacterium]MCP5426779.1 hydrolase [Chromatiaceae bacterium]MCB1870884.1 hydrolase [Gammaproteobacteria bacterium]MCB1879422.1 hydrolase [Gammaproteobacteria bacterium]MCB1904541.1 hydrolase [Gammaproteobacteria bacterium]
MAVSPISGTSLQGIQRGLQGMRRNAAEIANPRPAAGNAFPAKDGVRAMVELHQNAHLVTASLAAFSAADQMIGSLLDIKA